MSMQKINRTLDVQQVVQQPVIEKKSIIKNQVNEKIYAKKALITNTPVPSNIQDLENPKGTRDSTQLKSTVSKRRKFTNASGIKLKIKFSNQSRARPASNRDVEKAMIANNLKKNQIDNDKNSEEAMIANKQIGDDENAEEVMIANNQIGNDENAEEAMIANNQIGNDENSEEAIIPKNLKNKKNANVEDSKIYSEQKKEGVDLGIFAELIKSGVYQITPKHAKNINIVVNGIQLATEWAINNQETIKKVAEVGYTVIKALGSIYAKSRTKKKASAEDAT